MAPTPSHPGKAFLRLVKPIPRERGGFCQAKCRGDFRQRAQPVKDLEGKANSTEKENHPEGLEPGEGACGRSQGKIVWGWSRQLFSIKLH